VPHTSCISAGSSLAVCEQGAASTPGGGLRRREQSLGPRAQRSVSGPRLRERRGPWSAFFGATGLLEKYGSRSGNRPPTVRGVMTLHKLTAGTTGMTNSALERLGLRALPEDVAVSWRGIRRDPAWLLVSLEVDL
jgi:hypothetical protein